jgi:hypothetical protein
MATSCNTRTTTNIKDLPVTESINSGDYLIVETPGGSSILDFNNFIITTDNTTFGVVIEENTTNIITLSSEVKDLEVDTKNDFNVLSSQIAQLSSDLNNNSTFITFRYTADELVSYKENNAYLDPETSIDDTLTAPRPVTIYFRNNFTDNDYCVSANAIFKTEPITLSVLEVTNNSITVRGYRQNGTPSYFDKGWIRITTN